MTMDRANQGNSSMKWLCWMPYMRKDYTNEYVCFIDLRLEQGGHFTHRNNMAPIVWPSESESQVNSELVLVAI